MSTTTQVSSWDMIITVGGTYRNTLIFTDDTGTLFDWQTLEIIITPRTSAPFSLTQGNGKLTNTGLGTYLVLISDSETAGYTWTLGSYVMSATETNNDENPSFTSGEVIVRTP